MAAYDILFTLNQEGRFVELAWGNEQARKLYYNLFENWTQDNRRAISVFPISTNEKKGEFKWDNEKFSFEILDAPNNYSYLMLSKINHREVLLTKTLDQLEVGIQVYDKNACAVYFNNISRKISHVPNGVNPEGSHLLDLYNLDENISTTMTALRTHAPVINRVDHFMSSANTPIATSNTAYPIMNDGELLGAVVFEQTEEIIEQSIKRLEYTKKALISYASMVSEISFSGYNFENIIGKSQKILTAITIAKKIANQESCVLLVGETGTGKEIFAQSIHRHSHRSNKKFLAINCAAVPESLIESILFGTQKGSFTGSENKAGYFEEAAGGTLFLDELNSMSLSMQSKILRVIQENTFRRVGGSKDLKLDVRIISSCNVDPFIAIEDNQFRKDLFYRLSTIMIDLPPLREHLEDLDELIEYHLKSTSHRYVRAIEKIAPEVYSALRSYNWPGNVRELFHLLDYAQNVCDSGVMELKHLPPYFSKELLKQGSTDKITNSKNSFDFSSQTLQSLLEDYEHEILVSALDFCGYNISKTAETLGVLRQSLQYRIRKYGIII